MTDAIAAGPIVDLRHPSLYINQELSWLSFNERVQEEAEDPSHPLLERIKFLAIVSTNTDEFFMKQIDRLVDELLEERKLPHTRLPEGRRGEWAQIAADEVLRLPALAERLF